MQATGARLCCNQIQKYKFFNGKMTCRAIAALACNRIVDLADMDLRAILATQN
jgi:hypothetical protein